jgi:hypothetical protein
MEPIHPAIAIPELLDLVLHALPRDRRALKTFSLVSRGWSALVRRTLLSRIAIANDQHLKEVLTALREDPNLASYIRVLTIGPGGQISRDALARADTAALFHLSALSELAWIGIDWVPLVSTPERRDGLLAAFSTVRVLQLESVVSTSAGLLDFVHSFPVLRQFRLGNILTWASLPWDSAGSGVFFRTGEKARLEHLEVCGDAQPTLWEGLIDVLDFTALRSLVVRSFSPAAMRGLKRIVSVAGETLKMIELDADFTHSSECRYLSLSPVTCANNPTDRLAEHSDLVAEASSLATLSVRVNVLSQAAGFWLADAVAAVRSPSLARIELKLVVPLDTTTLRHDWAPLSAAFVKLSDMRREPRNPLAVEVRVQSSDVVQTREVRGYVQAAWLEALKMHGRQESERVAVEERLSS